MPRRRQEPTPATTELLDRETTVAEVMPEQEVTQENTPPVESPHPVQSEAIHEQEITSGQSAVESTMSTPAEIQPEEIPAPTVEQVVVPQQHRPPTMKAIIKAGDMENDLLATADVEVEGFGTFRNVRIKNGDYEPEVVLPKTRLPITGRWQEIFRFPSREMREQFNATVLDAYHQELEPQHSERQADEQLMEELESEEMGMTM